MKTDVMKYARLMFRSKGANPVYLIFFVTSRCTCRCGHCFYWQSTNKPEKELSLDEIQRISASMDSLLQVTFTGGDAALRKDLADIARIFVTQNQVRNFSIGTNGSQPEQIGEHLERMMSWLPQSGANVTIDLSIDGLGEEHDRIRALPGLFQNVLQSRKVIAAFQKRYSGINVCADITVSALNHQHLEPLYIFVRDEFKPDICNALLIRGNPRDPAALQVSLQRYEQLCQWIEEDVIRGRYPGYQFAPDLLNIKDMVLRKLIIKTARVDQYQVPCTAGVLTGVIYPEGKVTACELLDESLGSLRDVDYNMKNLWQSERAEQIRRDIRARRCYCIHQCFLSNNVLFNPRFLPQFMGYYLKILSRRVTVKPLSQSPQNQKPH